MIQFILFHPSQKMEIAKLTRDQKQREREERLKKEMMVKKMINELLENVV